MAMGTASQRRRATYLGLMGTFAGLLAAFAPGRKERAPLNLKPLDMAMLGLAAFRMGRLAAYDQVTKPVREPFTETEPDGSGAGDTTVPEGEGIQKAFGELIACPTCVGTWASAGLVYGLRIAPGPTKIFMTILAGTGLAEILDGLTEYLSWNGRAARVESAESE